MVSTKGTVLSACACAFVLFLVASLPAAHGSSASSGATAVAGPATSGLPSGVPPAALRPEPALPEPPASVWPFPDDAPRTSGTGRMADGALWWSDFLYDDHGATGASVSFPITAGAPTWGTYTYANPAAKGNGADIFRAAIG